MPRQTCFAWLSCLGKPEAQRQGEGHRVLRDRPVVDAAGIGKADAALRQLYARELVSAGADRLDEAELLRAVEKTVLPSPEITSTSASPTRFSNVSESRTAKLVMPALWAENHSCNR
jgi:hypothetical protein